MVFLVVFIVVASLFTLRVRDNFEQMVAGHRYFVARFDVIPGNELRRQIQVKTSSDSYHPPVFGDRLPFVDSLFHSVPRFIA